MPQDDWKATLRLDHKLIVFRNWLYEYAMSHAHPRDEPVSSPVDPQGKLVLVRPVKPLDMLRADASQAEFGIKAIFVPPASNPDRLWEVPLKDDAPRFDAITFHLQVSGTDSLLVEAHAAPYPGPLRFVAKMLKEILRICPEARADIEDLRERGLSFTVPDEVEEIIELAQRRAETLASDREELTEKRAEEPADQAPKREGGRPPLAIYDEAFDKEREGLTFAEIYDWFLTEADKEWLRDLADPKDSLKKALRHRRKKREDRE